MRAHVINLLDFDMADRMRKAREVAGYSQAALAAKLSIARQSVSNYEQRKTQPLPAIRKAWAEACGVSDSWLVTGVEERVTTRELLNNEQRGWGLAA